MSRPARTTVAALVVVVVASVLTACTGGDGKTLTYWSMWQKGEAQQKVLRAAFDEFTRKTGIKVEAQWSGRQVLSQVLPRINSGTPPDLIDQGGTDILGALGPVDGVQGLADVYSATVDGEKKTVGQVIPRSLVSAYRTKGGQPFLLPYEITGSTIWYNAKTDPQFDHAPATWSRFMSEVDKLKGEGRTPIALDGDIKDYCGYWMVWSLLRIGGPGLLSRSAGDGTGASFDDPAWKKAATAVEHLIKGGYFPDDFTATKFPTQQTKWAAGTSRTDLLLMGNWAPSETSAALSKSGKDPSTIIRYRSFPFPSFGRDDKGDGVVEAVPIGFAIPAKARNAEAARKFLTFFANKHRMAKIATRAKNLTPRTDIPAPPELADYAKEYRDATSYVQATDGLSVTHPKWLTDVWQPTVADFFAGKFGVDTFLRTLKRKTVAMHKYGG